MVPALKTLQNPKTFLAEYIDVISKIGQCVDGFVWWGCIISSKNRFYPRFTDLLLGNRSFALGFQDYGMAIFTLVKHLAVLYARLLLTQLFRGKHLREVRRKYAGRSVTVVKTFGYHFTNFSAFKDPIFQDLPAMLQESGEAVLTLYEPVNVFWKSVQETDPSRTTLSYFDLIGFTDPLKVIGKVLASYSKDDIFPLSFNGRDISREFRELYRFERCTPATFHALTYFYMTQRLCEQFEVKKYIYTFENNSWERMCLMAFRQFSPKSRLVAYQHNVVPLASANMFLGKGEESNSPVPDVVLTTGPKPREILQSYGHYHKVRLHSSAAIRYRYLESITPVDRCLERPTLVIALEGVWPAATIMNEVFAQGKELNNWRVVIRTHQALPYEKLKSRIQFDVADYPHFELSLDRSLTDDLKAATAVLYWGSSVSLEAIKFGKPLINIKLSGPLDFDPLFEIQALKYDWTPPASLASILKLILELSPEEYQRLSRLAQEYLADYFHPVTKDNLREFFL